MKHIAVITGGTGSEREVSLRSAQSVYTTLESKYQTTLFTFPEEIDAFTQVYKNIDFAFVMVHGKEGEDGMIPSFLDVLAIPYQCTNPDILHTTFNKTLTKHIWSQHNLPIAKEEIIQPKNLTKEEIHNTIEDSFGYPVVCKSPTEGSSNGVFILRTPADLDANIVGIKSYDIMMLEEFIEWPECTVSILDVGWEPTALPVIEIIPPEGWEFDYENKYNGKTQEICPARFSDTLTQQIQDIALDAYTAIRCTKYGRIDVMVGKNGPILLEINTIPGFTDQSLFPLAAKTAGISFFNILEILIE